MEATTLKLPNGGSFFIDPIPSEISAEAEANGISMAPFDIDGYKGLILDEANTKKYMEHFGLRPIAINPTAYTAIMALKLEKGAADGREPIAPVAIEAAEEDIPDEAEDALPEVPETVEVAEVDIDSKKQAPKLKKKGKKEKLEPIVLEEVKPAGKVSVSLWMGANNEADFVATTEKILMPFLKRDIDIVVAHRSKYKLRTDGLFRVIIWGSPTLSPIDEANMIPNEMRPTTMFGYPVDLSRDFQSIKYSGSGLAIGDGESEYVIAEFHKDHLFILHDACHTGTKNEQGIYEAILQQFVDEQSLTPEARAAKEADKLRKYHQRQKDNYIAMCSKRSEADMKSLDSQIINNAADLQNVSTKVITYSRLAVELRKKRSIYDDGFLIPQEKYAEEFDKLLDNPKIVKVECPTESMFKVYTKVLYCTDPRTNKVHEIGEFCITLPNINQATVEFRNLTRTVVAHGGKPSHAPHVFERGNACLGSMNEILGDLISKYELAALASMLIVFIESVNTDDSAGKLIDKWPVDEERTAALAAELEAKKEAKHAKTKKA